MEGLVWFVPAAIILSVIVVIYLARDVLSRPVDRSSDTSDLIPAVQSLSAEEQSQLFERMTLNGDRIYSGATAFLKRQYRTIAWMTIVGAGLLAVLLLFYGANEEKGIEAGDLAWRTGV